MNQPINTLFFAAGVGNEEHGLYGRIEPVQRHSDDQVVVNFQSRLDPFIILMALPGALAGIPLDALHHRYNAERALALPHAPAAHICLLSHD
jgi:hypothetical protein